MCDRIDESQRSAVLVLDGGTVSWSGAGSHETRLAYTCVVAVGKYARLFEKKSLKQYDFLGNYLVI